MAGGGGGGGWPRGEVVAYRPDARAVWYQELVGAVRFRNQYALVVCLAGCGDVLGVMMLSSCSR